MQASEDQVRTSLKRQLKLEKENERIRNSYSQLLEQMKIHEQQVEALP